MLLCRPQSELDQVNLGLWCFDTPLGLLLKGMQNVHSCLEPDRVCDPAGIPSYLETTSTTHSVLTGIGHTSQFEHEFIKMKFLFFIFKKFFFVFTQN